MSPRFHTVRYSGVLAAASKWRRFIVPQPVPQPVPTETTDPASSSDQQSCGPPPECVDGSRYRPWAELLKRTFGINVENCPRCGPRWAGSLFVIVRGSPAHHPSVNVSVVGVLGAALVGSAFWASAALGATGGRLAYDAPAGCATRAEFVASVAERGAVFDGAAAAGTAQELRVSIAATSRGFAGTFQTVRAEGASAVRELHGGTCSEVVAALAVVSAIALRGDDDSQLADAKPEGSITPSAPPTPAPPLATLSKPAPLPEPATRDEGRLRARSALGGPPEKVEVGAGTLRFHQARSLSLFAGGELGILPSTVVPRYDVSVSAAPFVTTPEGNSYIAGVVTRIRASYFGNASYRAADGSSVAAQGIGIGMSLCWAPTYDTRGIAALFCTEYGLGVLQFKSVTPGRYFATGAGTAVTTGAATRTQSPALQTGGLSFEGEYRLGSFLHLALKAGADVALQPIGAEHPDGSRIFRSSILFGYGMLGLGFHL